MILVVKDMKYRVAGRVLKGTSVTHYLLIREDGKQDIVSRDRAIWLISNGLIENMRIQVLSDSDIIIRGKGVNLNNLPVYDKDKLTGKASVETLYKINRRIMRGARCIGYEVVTSDNKVLKLSKDDVYKLSNNRLVTNAEVKTLTENGVKKQIIRGVGCNLLNLDVIILSENNRVIDKNSKTKEVTLRTILMKNDGLLENTKTKEIQKFKSGDFLVVGVSGNIVVISKEKIINEFIVDKSTNIATCDSILDNIEKYTIRVYGGSKIEINKDKIKKWTIIRKK